MKTFIIKFHLVSETGYNTELTFEKCYNITLNDEYFEFIDEYSGYLYHYYLKDIPETQSAKIIDKIEIKENMLS